MILRTPNGPSVHVFFLPSQFVRLLDRMSIPLRELQAIETYHQKLMWSELGQFFKFQYQVAQEMGVPMLEPDMRFSKDYEGGMLREAFNSVDGSNLSKLIHETQCFSYLNAGQNVLVLALHPEEDDKPLPGWACAEATSFSGALLEMIVHTKGYMESHLGAIPEPRTGEFSLAVVYKLLGLQNP